MSFITLFLISLSTLILFTTIKLIKKNTITKNFYKNKDFIKYVSFIGVLTILTSSLFVDKYGNLIPSILEYFKPEKVRDLNVADQYIVNLGYFGSFLAGTLGLIFGFISLIFLVFTFLNQSRKNEISDIENRIFKLIELLVEIKNQNNLSQISQIFLKDNENLSNLELFKNKLKDQHLDFSNFFRMLYQILKYINQHEHIIHNRYCDKNLDPKVKSYTNIIRSYLDTNLLTCLAINCYCLEEENGEYLNYKNLLERYELLEHLPNILPIQFSSYLYYNKKAFGNSTWFQNFNSIRKELVEISNFSKTSDFCEIFLLFLSKNNGTWNNEKAIMKVTINNLNFELSVKGIENQEIPKDLIFKIEKQKGTGNLNLVNYPFNASAENQKFLPNITKSENKLNLSYLKPNASYSIGEVINLKLLILTTGQVEMELENTSLTFSILPF